MDGVLNDSQCWRTRLGVSYSLFKISGRRVFLTLLNTNCILMSVSQSAKEISIKLIGMGI